MQYFPFPGKKAEAWAPGRSLVQGEPIVPEAPGGEDGAVVVAQPLELPGLCEPASKTKLRGGKKAKTVAASWHACAGFRGRPKLTGHACR